MAKYLDEEDEMLEQQQAQQTQQPPEQGKKSNRWENIDYSKFTIPEGVKVTNAEVTRIPPKDGEQWPTFVISADIDGKHYEQELWNNDRKAFYEKDGEGRPANRVTVEQLVAKYFGKQLAESATAEVQERKPGILKRLLAWIKGLRFRKVGQEQGAEPGTKEAVNRPRHVPYSDQSDTDERYRAIRAMGDLQMVIDDYEKKIATNNGIVINARKLYADRADYIRRLKDTIFDGQTADCTPLLDINERVEESLDNIAGNLIGIPFVKRYVERRLPMPEPKTPAVQEQRQQQQATEQDANADVRAELQRIRRRVDIWQTVAVVACLCVGAAVTQCSTRKGYWQEEAYNEGIEAAQQKIDSLIQANAFLAQKRHEEGEWAKHYASRLREERNKNARQEVSEFFKQYDDFRTQSQKIERLERQNQEQAKELKTWAEAYDKLRKTTNDYAQAYNKAVAKAKAKTDALPDVPEQHKPAFNTVDSKKDDNPYSPGSR